MERATVSTLALFVCSLALGQKDCALKIDSEGIKVFVCSSEHDQLKSIRTEFILEHTNLIELEKFLMRVELYPKWQYHIMEAEILEKINDNEMIYRTLVTTPWPVAPREMIVRFKKKKDPANQKMEILINNVDHRYPQNKNRVRVPSSTATWTVQSITGTSLKVIYTLRLDPGGVVPVWLVNTALADGPFITFRNLKKMLPENKTGR